MARVAVAHPQFTLTGGAEAVCANVLEALQEHYDVSLVTATRPDLDRLNAFHGTSVSDVSVVGPPPACRTLNSLAGPRFAIAHLALLNRYLRRHEDAFDLVVSTFNEFRSDRPCICYFHHPVYDRTGLPHDVQSNALPRRIYKRFAAVVAGVSADSLATSTLLANSEWTATTVERVYGTRPKAVYPPVAVDEFSDPPPPVEDREFGFVSVGRIAPDKNVLRSIDIVTRLRERGHDVHLHLAGPVQRTGYHERVSAAVAAHDFVEMEGTVSRDRLIELLETHRFGLHGKEYEHFGIAVVEMLAAGMVPFLPATGGQREIVDGRDEVLYDSVDDAVRTIDRVLSTPDLERALLDEFDDVPERYGRRRFQRQIREVVARTVTGDGNADQS